MYCVADSSFYTDNNIKNIGKEFWIRRVSATITEAKELLNANLNLKTLKSDKRYSFYQTFVEYGRVKQKWILLRSHKLKEGVTKTGAARKRKWLKTNYLQREEQVEIKIKWSTCGK